MIIQAYSLSLIIKVRDPSPLNRQKSYENQWHRPINFQGWDKVFLRISSTRGAMRFGKKSKLSTWFVGPYQIL